MRKKSVAVVAVVFLIVLASWAKGALSLTHQVEGDLGDISIVVSCSPGVDKYGRPSINPDGTFYPDDSFLVSYKVLKRPDLTLTWVGASYDSSALELLLTDNWGGEAATGLFRVRPNAKPGTYAVSVTATATKEFSEPSGSGTVRVTKGGIKVTAYYEMVKTANATKTTVGGYALAGEGNVALASAVSSPTSSSPTSPPKLRIEKLSRSLWYDVFRGVVCGVSGYVYSDVGPVAGATVTVEFLKRSLLTGAEWIVQKTSRSGGDGYFVAEDTCIPIIEAFIGVRAWAEAPGYLPSWDLSVAVEPSPAVVERGGGVLVGVTVRLTGRYSEVPVALSISDLPPNFNAIVEPSSGSASGVRPFQSVIMLSAGEGTPIGSYSATIAVSSGRVAASAKLAIEVVEPRPIHSYIHFSAQGLGQDATGTVLVIDGGVAVDASELPYTGYYLVGTTHSYAWASRVGSRLSNENVTVYYELKEVRVVEYYFATAALEVRVVEYDPHFTAVVYTIPKSPGENSYEKQFAILIRYDGNGPERNLKQRAVLEGFDWNGWAKKIPQTQNLTKLTVVSSSTANIENLQNLLKEFNATQRGATFSAVGIEKCMEFDVVAVIDGKEVRKYELPKTYDWAEGSTHKYKWMERLPVYRLFEYVPVGYTKADDEWLSFEYVQVSPPRIDLNVTEIDVGRIREVAGALSATFTSPEGEVVVSGTGVRVTAVYGHNKLLRSLAKAAGVSEGDALKLVNAEMPIYFDEERRYAKLVFDLDDRVAREATSQGFNTSVFYDITFLNEMFGKRHAFSVNYTCYLEFFKKAVNVTALKWDGGARCWVVDRDAMVEVIFGFAFNSTEMDWFLKFMVERGADDVMLEMVREDVYECYPQYFGGLGSATGVMVRTGAFIYNLNATAGYGRYEVGSLPQPPDSWTEKVRGVEAWWESPTSKLSEDAGFKVAGEASVRVEEEKAGTASAILTLLRPVNALPESELRFKIFLGQSFAGEVTVYVEGLGDVVNRSFSVPHGKWVELSVKGLPNNIKRIGVYAKLASGEGTMWIDDLSLSNVLVWTWEDARRVNETVYVNFASEEPFTIYVNLDPRSPLPVNLTEDRGVVARLLVNASKELGGLKRINVYVVLDAPNSDVKPDSIKTKPLLSVNLTEPKTWVEEPVYSGYRGYAELRGDSLGFAGEVELVVVKGPDVKAPPNLDKALLLIEAENVWGTRFYSFVEVQPWRKPFVEVVFEQVAMTLLGIAATAIILGIVIKLIRRAWGKEE